MVSPFDFAHLDPSCDPPESYLAAFDLLAVIWGQLQAFRAAHPHDQFLLDLTARLETQLVTAGVCVVGKGRPAGPALV